MKKIVIISAVVLLIGLGWFVTSKSTTPQAPSPTTAQDSPAAVIPQGSTVVTLTKDGYVPDRVTIKKGDTITFKTTNGKLFWPASNLHPSHALYPEFDPKAPIQADESWSFTFMVPGTHPFHDHLAPYYTGVITVTE